MKKKIIFIVIGCIFSFIITLSILLNSEKSINNTLTNNNEIKQITFANPDKYLPKVLDINSEFNIVIEKNTVIKEKPLPIFRSSIISNKIFKIIDGVSYKSNKSLNIKKLRYLEISYWSFDGKEYKGELICNKLVSNDLLEIFEELYYEKYEIEKIHLVDIYNGDDLLSMKDNNSHSFNYRNVAGTNVLSNHSFGLAIDINPIQNPYINGKNILPKEGRSYKNRKNIRQGMIIKGDFLYNAFIKRGWIWGGNWKKIKDYQHFEKILKIK